MHGNAFDEQHFRQSVVHQLCNTGVVCCMGQVFQSIVSLTSSLRDQLIKCFRTLLPNTLIFLVEKMREAFAVQKLHTFFQPKIVANFRYLHLKF